MQRIGRVGLPEFPPSTAEASPSKVATYGTEGAGSIMFDVRLVGGSGVSMSSLSSSIGRLMVVDLDAAFVAGCPAVPVAVVGGVPPSELVSAVST